MSTRRKIQLLLWAYFWLVILEGALRKWVLPGLSTPLLLIRDPFAVAAVALGLPYLMRRPWIGWVSCFWAIGVVAVFLAITVGHGDLITALAGARILWFHVPLAFLFASVFTRDDAIKFSKAAAIVAIPMAILAAMQYSLPQSHFLNVAPGGEEGGGFSGALGKFRPPGTFSFTNGLVEFFGLAAACVVGLLVAGPRPIPKWLWASAGSLLVALPVSISRALLYKYVFVFLAFVASGLTSGRALKRVLVAAVIVTAVGAGVSQFAVVKDARRTFLVRWENANEQEGGGEGANAAVQSRVGGSTLGALTRSLSGPLLGHGIGIGTNIGAMRLAGRRTFMVGEGAWSAAFGELGALLGAALIGLRLVFLIFVLRLSLVQARRGNVLPLVLCGYAAPVLFMGGTAQPTALGFFVLSAGFTLMACNPTNAEMQRRLAMRRQAKEAAALCEPSSR